MGGSGCWENNSSLQQSVSIQHSAPHHHRRLRRKTFETRSKRRKRSGKKFAGIAKIAKESKLSAVTPRVAIFNHQSLAILPALSLQLNSTCIPIPLLLPSWKIQAFSPRNTVADGDKTFETRSKRRKRSGKKFAGIAKMSKNPN
jgi:hypothetical protein